MVGDDRNWDYLDLSSGRYYCVDHGGFCDLADNYAKKCPLCSGDTSSACHSNHVQRTLRLINGLQERSKRSFTLATSIFGGLGLLKVLDAPASGGGLSALKTLFVQEEVENAGYAQFTALILLLLSIAFFSWSMRHINVTDSSCEIPKKTHTDWVHILQKNQRSMEVCHLVGSLVLSLSVIVLAWSFITPHLSEFWQ